MTRHTPDREPLEQLAEEFSERHRRGERPSVSEYTARYPELADDIRALFPALLEMEQLASVEGPATGPLLPAPNAHPQRLGEYRIVREVGHGGMGVVYEAVQESLGRHVALKVLPVHGLHNPLLLERFKREAKAAAKLHHTNIVPVFGVGEDQGVHYYAMQFIQGQGLDKVLDEVRRLRAGQQAAAPTAGAVSRELSVSVAHGLLSGQFDGPKTDEAGAHSEDSPAPTEASTDSGLGTLPEGQYYRSVARVGLQAAAALAYAHGQKVLHRDIKPANLLLDRQGIVWVADFGLAKDEGDNLTRTGDVVGTLRYLPPERLQGHSDARGDVYSLGMTLYELLALRPAFEESNRARLVEQIAQEQPARPRKVDPRIPRDLETVVLKAIDKEPSRRYPTAAALADDLQRFLAGLPIQARPTPTWERLWKWARRRPAQAAVLLISGAALLLLVAGAVGLWYHGRLQEAFDETRRALEEKDRLQYFHRIGLAHGDWRDGNLFGVEELLDACPEERRSWEWHYLKRLCHADLLTLASPDGLANWAVFSPDGLWLASGKTVWEATTGRVLGPLEGNRAVAFNPDGSRLAFFNLSARKVKVLDLSTWQEACPPLPVPGNGGVVKVAFSPDGRWLAAGHYMMAADVPAPIQVWDTRTWQEIPSLEGHAFGVAGLAFHPDETRLVSASHDRTLKVWDTITWKAVQTLRGHTGIVYSVAFSPDGSLLFSGSMDGTVKVWDTTAWRELAPPVHRHPIGVVGLRPSPDGTRLATAGYHPTVKVWDVATRALLHTLKGHTRGAWTADFSPDGTRLASSSEDGTVKVWDATLDPEGPSLIGHGDHVRSVAFGPDGSRLASASKDRTVRIWDVATGQLLRTLSGHTAQVESVTFSPDGSRLASLSQDGTVRVWDPATGQEALRFSGYAGRVHCIAFSPDGRWLAFPGAEENRVTVWDVTTKRLAHTFSGHDGPVHGVAFSPDGRWLASAHADTQVRLWDLTTGQGRPTILAGHTSQVWMIAFSPDGTRLASGSWDSTARIWEVKSGQLLHTLAGHTNDVMSVAFSRDGSRLATASNDGTVKIWDTTHGELLLTLTGHRTCVISVAFSPDGTRLASASEDHTVRIWDGRPWTPEAALEREALGRLEFLYRKPLCKADVLDYLRTSPLLRPAARQMALSLVDRYAEETDPERYRQASWSIVRQPYLNAFQYGFALLQSQTACRLASEPGKYATALGAAQYRCGLYAEARGTLSKADQLGGSTAAGLAFLTMTQHQLGRIEEARKSLDRLRSTVEPTDREAADLLRQAESLLARR